MRHTLITFASLALLFLTSCHKQEEIDFSGTVLDIRSCTTLTLSADRNAAHIIALDSPTDVGGEYADRKNVVVLYEPTTHIRVDDHIHGTFYFDNDYSSANCNWHSTDYDLPQGVFTKTVVD
ncbi:MAG: hypothetical protein IJU19_07570 [Bacteroidales bacterium]|nr:hypothetical protein [Bacteroidales bacterium]